MGKVGAVKEVLTILWLWEMLYLSRFVVAHGGLHRYVNFHVCWVLSTHERHDTMLNVNYLMFRAHFLILLTLL